MAIKLGVLDWREHWGDWRASCWDEYLDPRRRQEQKLENTAW